MPKPYPQFFGEGFDSGKFRTRNITLASTLTALGFNAEVERQQDRDLCTFVFVDTSSLKKAIDGFWNKELSIEPQCMIEAYEVIKSRTRTQRAY